MKNRVHAASNLIKKGLFPFHLGFSLNVNTRKVHEVDASLPKPSTHQNSSHLCLREAESRRGLASPALGHLKVQHNTFRNLLRMILKHVPLRTWH